MNILKKSVICCIILLQGSVIFCGDEGTQNSKILGKRTKTALLLAAPYVTAWNITRFRESTRTGFLLGHWGEGLSPVSGDYSKYIKKESPCAPENTVVFQYEFNRSLKRWYLFAVGTYVAKSLYDSYKEYRRGNLMQNKKGT